MAFQPSRGGRGGSAFNPGYGWRALRLTRITVPVHSISAVYLGPMFAIAARS
jgi:hypothetical protein